jgi:hypothetical protein
VASTGKSNVEAVDLAAATARCATDACTSVCPPRRGTRTAA